MTKDKILPKIRLYKDTGLPLIAFPFDASGQKFLSNEGLLETPLMLTEVSLPKREVPKTRLHTEYVVLQSKKLSKLLKEQYRKLNAQLKEFYDQTEEGIDIELPTIFLRISKNFELSIDFSKETELYRKLYDGWFRLAETEDDSDFF